MNEHRHSDHGHAHHVDFDSPERADHIEREGEVLVDLLHQAIARLGALAAAEGLDVRQVLDLGSGPGVGSCLLAQHFEGARVVAVDGSTSMLERVVARAKRLGVAPQVDTRLVELPAGLPDLDQADVVWASMVIHHLGDETDAFRQIRGLLAPGGLLALVERADALRAVPREDDLGRPGLWDRLDAASDAWFAQMRAELPDATASVDYPTMLANAGFEVVANDVLAIVLDPPLDEQARRFARDYLAGARERLESHVDAADLEALDVFLDDEREEGIARRQDVELHASRRLYVARSVD